MENNLRPTRGSTRCVSQTRGRWGWKEITASTRTSTIVTPSSTTPAMGSITDAPTVTPAGIPDRRTHCGFRHVTSYRFPNSPHSLGSASTTLGRSPTKTMTCKVASVAPRPRVPRHGGTYQKTWMKGCCTKHLNLREASVMNVYQTRQRRTADQHRRSGKSPVQSATPAPKTNTHCTNQRREGLKRTTASTCREHTGQEKRHRRRDDSTENRRHRCCSVNFSSLTCPTHHA